MSEKNIEAASEVFSSVKSSSVKPILAVKLVVATNATESRSDSNSDGESDSDTKSAAEAATKAAGSFSAAKNGVITGDIVTEALAELNAARAKYKRILAETAAQKMSFDRSDLKIDRNESADEARGECELAENEDEQRRQAAEEYLQSLKGCTEDNSDYTKNGAVTVETKCRKTAAAQRDDGKVVESTTLYVNEIPFSCSREVCSCSRNRSLQ